MIFFVSPFELLTEIEDAVRSAGEGPLTRRERAIAEFLAERFSELYSAVQRLEQKGGDDGCS